MVTSELIDRYLLKHSKWEAQLTTFRKLFLDSPLEETVKWGVPTYVYNKKLVAGFAAFKAHCAIWFHQGYYLKDTAKVLINAQEGKTKAMRQWRFEMNDDLPEEIIATYILEAYENAKAGKFLKPEKKENITTPSILQQALDNDPKLMANFLALTPGKQIEYKTYIAEAKREATQKNRVEKCIPLILDGNGLYDRYKNC